MGSERPGTSLWPVRAKPNSLALVHTLRGWASSPWTAVPGCSTSPGSALPPDHPECPHPFHSLTSPWVAQGLPSILSSELSLLNSFDRSPTTGKGRATRKPHPEMQGHGD